MSYAEIRKSRLGDLVAVLIKMQSGTAIRNVWLLAVTLSLHCVFFWALQKGLTYKIVELLPQGIQARIIVEDTKREKLPRPPEVESISLKLHAVPPPTLEVQQLTPPPASAKPVIYERPSSFAAVTSAGSLSPDVDIAEPRIDSNASETDIARFYPESAKHNGVQGEALIHVLVGPTGSVLMIQVLQSSSSEKLDAAAIAYARSLRFVPGLRGGKPTAMWFKLPVAFKLLSAVSR